MRRYLCVTAAFAILVAVVSAAGTARAQNDISGLWTGTTRVTPPCSFSSGRCNAVNNITFSIQQNGNRFKGKFTCAYGNLNCRNGGADNTGKIVSGRINGADLRISVVVPADVSNCYYNGRVLSPNSIRGAYSCYQGGELLEEGIFDVKRGAAG